MNDLADTIGRKALEAVALEWRKQGHELSGDAVRNMSTVSLPFASGIRIEGYVPDYMAYLNAGIPRERIPYTPNSGKPFSKYIEGLKEYAKKRMNKSDKEALGVAFAIASKHKREGMPTRSSARFSQTGKRTGFIETALQAAEPDLEQEIRDNVEKYFGSVFQTYFKSVLKR